jgi:DNA-binding response OmpR family regulator
MKNGGGSEMDVLLVEDNPDMRALLQLMLEKRSHTVTSVADGESGWANYARHHFPLVILDWILPGIDGLEVCRRIRSSPNGADSLILMITANTHLGDLEEALTVGVDDYLTKPFELELLNVRLAIAEQRVSNRRQRKETNVSLRLAESVINALTR